MGKKVAVRYIICIVKEETSLKQLKISKLFPRLQFQPQVWEEEKKYERALGYTVSGIRYKKLER